MTISEQQKGEQKTDEKCVLSYSDMKHHLSRKLKYIRAKVERKDERLKKLRHSVDLYSRQEQKVKLEKEKLRQDIRHLMARYYETNHDLKELKEERRRNRREQQGIGETKINDCPANSNSEVTKNQEDNELSEKTGELSDIATERLNEQTSEARKRSPDSEDRYGLPVKIPKLKTEFERERDQETDEQESLVRMKLVVLEEKVEIIQKHLSSLYNLQTQESPDGDSERYNAYIEEQIRAKQIENGEMALYRVELLKSIEKNDEAESLREQNAADIALARKRTFCSEETGEMSPSTEELDRINQSKRLKRVDDDSSHVDSDFSEKLTEKSGCKRRTKQRSLSEGNQSQEQPIRKFRRTDSKRKSNDECGYVKPKIARKTQIVETKEAKSETRISVEQRQKLVEELCVTRQEIQKLRSEIDSIERKLEH